MKQDREKKQLKQEFKRDFNEYYTDSRDTELTRELNQDLMDFDQWLEKYGSKIPIE